MVIEMKLIGSLFTLTNWVIPPVNMKITNFANTHLSASSNHFTSILGFDSLVAGISYHSNAHKNHKDTTTTHIPSFFHCHSFFFVVHLGVEPSISRL